MNLEVKKIVKENFKGLDDVIKDKINRKFYKDLIETCIEEYAKEFKEENMSLRHSKKDLIKRNNLLQKENEKLKYEQLKKAMTETSTKTLSNFLEKENSRKYCKCENKRPLGESGNCANCGKPFSK